MGSRESSEGNEEKWGETEKARILFGGLKKIYKNLGI